MFVGTLIEGLTALISLALWAGALPVVMDPRKGLAQMYVGKQSDEVIDYQPIISNANLYFCSWGAAVCVLSVFAQYVRERLGGGHTRGSGGMGYTNLWYLLGLASVVVVIEGMRFKNQVCVIDGGAETATCGRNTYGLVTGEYDMYIQYYLLIVLSIYGLEWLLHHCHFISRRFCSNPSKFFISSSIITLDPLATIIISKNTPTTQASSALSSP